MNITPSVLYVCRFTRAHADGGDAGRDSADAYAEAAGACAGGYEAHPRVRRACADVGDEYRARADVHAPTAHANAHGRALQRGADRRQPPSAPPRRSE